MTADLKAPATILCRLIGDAGVIAAIGAAPGWRLFCRHRSRNSPEDGSPIGQRHMDLFQLHDVTISDIGITTSLPAEPGDALRSAVT